MTKQFLLALFLLLAGCAKAAKIKIHVMYYEKGQAKNLKGADVKCWDEDYPDGDDTMTGTVKTDSNGRATLTYKKKKKSTWYSPNRGWDGINRNSNPDIYCRIKKTNVVTMHTKTKMNQNQGKTADFGTVIVYPDRVARGDPGSKNGCGPGSLPKEATDISSKLTGVKQACNNHDLCWENCDETMLSCDKEFKAIAYSICEDKNDHYSTKRACKLPVDAMYKLIREFGGDGYKDTRKKVGCAARKLRGAQ